MKISILTTAMGSVLLIPALFAQLNENCTVAVANRTARVAADGTWRVPNVPTGFPNLVPLTARATCVENGIPQTGQSPIFLGTPNGPVGLPQILIGTAALIPVRMAITANVPRLTTPNQTATLTVTATFADNSTKDVTKASTGTTYRISNSSLATISPDGAVTAKASGTVLIQALNEGTQGLLQMSIALSGDSDGDGIPDDVEIANGLDPNNPADAADDADHDGLTNLEEFQAGTDMRNADTDGDGLTDGQEVKTLHTNPLVKDTDGDGVPDNIEVATGSDPNNPNSFNLGAALNGIRVTPTTFTLSPSAVGGSGSQQLTVTGDFKLGGSIDLTAKSKGTTYTSSAPAICTFGVVDGRVIAGSSGSCVITIANNGFTATSSGTVANFVPTALSKINFPAGYANGVEVTGNFAYIAAGAAGLVIVDVSDAAHPRIVSTTDTPGNANAVRVVGRFAFVADGSSGLQVIDVSNPAAPAIAGAAETGGEALDLTIFRNRAYVADGNSGVAVVSITNPANPNVVAQIATPGKVRAVDLLPEPDGTLYAVVADDKRDTTDTTAVVALRVINVTDLRSASIAASLTLATNSIQVVRVSGSFAFIAGGNELGNGLIANVDLTNPLAPIIRGPQRNGASKDLKIAGRTEMLGGAANTATVNDITDPVSPGPLMVLDYAAIVGASTFSPFTTTGVALKGQFAYVTTVQVFNSVNEKGATFVDIPTALIIFQIFQGQDTLGVSPSVTAADPPGNSTVLAGSTVPLSAIAADDVSVKSVTFQVNGTDVATDDSQPYGTMFNVPANATSLTISTRTADFGNNVSIPVSNALTVVADPLTTVSGRVVRTNGTTVTGAAVTCFTVSATTNANGQFTFTGVPIANGEISCTATITEGGRLLRGKTGALALVPSGTTNAGDLTVRRVAKILMITSKANQTAASIAKELREAGSDVTLRPPPQNTWDNTNPPAANFDCVVHLNANANLSFTFSATTQQALVNYVRGGGGYIGFAPSPVDDSSSSPMHELTLFPGPTVNNGTSQLRLTYTKTPGQESHPVTAGFPNSFPISSREQTKTSTSFFPFTQDQPAEVLSVLNGNHGVAVRQLGTGRVVRFAVGDSFQDNGAPFLVVPDASLLKLVTNAAGWACGQ